MNPLPELYRRQDVLFEQIIIFGHENEAAINQMDGNK